MFMLLCLVSRNLWLVEGMVLQMFMVVFCVVSILVVIRLVGLVLIMVMWWLLGVSWGRVCIDVMCGMILFVCEQCMCFLLIVVDWWVKCLVVMWCVVFVFQMGYYQCQVDGYGEIQDGDGDIWFLIVGICVCYGMCGIGQFGQVDG